MVTIPVEVEHLIAYESTPLVRRLSQDPRMVHAPNLDVVWKKGTWWVPPFNPSGHTYLLAKNLESSLRLCPWVVKCDFKAFYPSMPPRIWICQLVAATGWATESVLRCIHRLRVIAAEISMGAVGLPVGANLSVAVGNAVLFPLDDVLVGFRHVLAYLRWTDDIGIGVPDKTAGFAVLNAVNDYSKKRGLSLHDKKTGIVPGRDFRMLGDASSVDVTAELHAPAEWDGPAFLSRAAVRAVGVELRCQDSDRALDDFARRAPRMLVDVRAIERGLRSAGNPIPAEVATATVLSLADNLDKIHSVGTAGSLLLRMTEKGRGVEDSPHLRSALSRLVRNPHFNEHGRASAAWMLAKTTETCDHRLIADAEHFTPPAARAVYGASLMAGGSPGKVLWRAMALTPTHLG